MLASLFFYFAHWRIYLLAGFCLAASGLQAQDFNFASLQGTPINTTGWRMEGGAVIGNSPGNTGNGEIILTAPVNGSSGAIFYNTPIVLSQCKKWIAEFDFRIFDGTVADGFAFCFLDVPPSGFVSGGGIGIPSSANGLKVVFDTYVNCGIDNAPKLQIRYGVGYQECNGQPTRNNNDGALSFIRSATYNTGRIEYDEGNIKVLLNGVEYLTAFQTFSFSGYFGFTASTGGFNDRHSIKNVRIFTEMPQSTAGLNGLEFCPNQVGQIGGPSSPGIVYKWTPETGLSNPNISNPTVQVNNATANRLNIKYIVETAYEDRQGCASRDSVNVAILPTPRAAFTHDTVCITGGTVQFTNTTTFDGSPMNNGFYQWEFGDINSANNTSLLQNPAHLYETAGIFNVSLVATSAQGCKGDTVISINPMIAPPEVDFTFLGDSCEGYLLNFIATVNQANVTSSWNFGDEGTSFLQSPSHLYDSSGIFNVVYQAQNSYCPAQSISKPISIRTSPKLLLQNADSVVCLNEPELLLNRVAVNNLTEGVGIYTGNGIENNVFSPRLASEGLHTISYTFEGINGCKSEIAFNVEVLPPPFISAGPDKTLLEANPVMLSGEAGADVESFVWSPNIQISDINVLNPIVSPTANQWYKISANGLNGCKAVDSVLVTVLPSFFIPNAFSPNGDGINDEWIIKDLNNYRDSEIRVFDRYGKTVFSSVGYNRPWNGKSINGIPVPSGVYFFIINPKNGLTIRQGSVTIIR